MSARNAKLTALAIIVLLGMYLAVSGEGAIQAIGAALVIGGYIGARAI